MPVPSDPNFELPPVDEEAFSNPPKEEDADLQRLDAWDDEPGDEEDDEDLDDEDDD